MAVTHLIPGLRLVLVAALGCLVSCSTSPDAQPRSSTSTSVVATNLAAQGGDDDEAGEETSLDQAAPTVHVITHGDGGAFWSVVERGAMDAGRDLGVNVEWRGTSNNIELMVTEIDGAVAAGSDGIIASVPVPDDIIPALRRGGEGGRTRPGCRYSPPTAVGMR